MDELETLRVPSMTLAGWLTQALDNPAYSPEFQAAIVAWLRAFPADWWNQQRSERPPCVW